ncbi:B3/B4 domain-containing protein [Companilactobacillus jidongensis]|uniref:B3/B4 domain-containing protein n=1 Tax=Companilactobacillus jidongensis TaxID=2486006 RepID=UPI000F7B839F|nr:phenylalanine--tRNA ligase beta subunit-related protein [Companilactobacillus jidongensis]
MNFKLNQSLVDLGISNIVIGKVTGVDFSQKLDNQILKELKINEDKALKTDLNQLRNNQIINGYVEMVKKIGRSLKKNPPTAEALIGNIQHRGSFPRVNSVVDVYNIESLQSYLSIGAHDMDKIDFPIEFTVSNKVDIFSPILAPDKKVADYDYVYRDKNGILAYLDCRDSELYKIDDSTKNILFVVQGNEYTTVQYRVDALTRVCETLNSIMPKVKYSIEVISSEG